MSREQAYKKWTITTSRHRQALVFAMTVMWGSNQYSSSTSGMQNGWTATIGVGLWSIHIAYRKKHNLARFAEDLPFDYRKERKPCMEATTSSKCRIC